MPPFPSAAMLWRWRAAPPRPRGFSRAAINALGQSKLELLGVSKFGLNKALIAARDTDAILDLFDQRGPDFNEVNLATALHRLARATKRSGGRKAQRREPRVDAIVDWATVRMSKKWRPRSLANACWSVVRIGGRDSAAALLAKVANEAPRRMRQFNAQELSNTAWAFAKWGFDAPNLHAAIAEEAPKKIADFKAQELANIAWAYSRAGVEAPRLYAAASSEAMLKMDHFNSQDLTNMVWAYATAGVPAPELFDAIAHEALKKLDTFNAQEFANLVWAFSTAGVSAPLLYAAVAAEAPRAISTFKAQELSITLWAFAKAGVPAPALYDAVAEEAPRKLETFTSQNLYNIIFAYNTSGSKAPDLLEAARLALYEKRDQRVRSARAPRKRSAADSPTSEPAELRRKAPWRPEDAEPEMNPNSYFKGRTEESFDGKNRRFPRQYHK
mmetsp:Transcript_16551/g.58788  ORF Transcript_16551/g.58788 Transcript_16551/m.58788 type:complete len:443 (-) Transcript_16551:21-1349(-)